jgi:hypothetical protein
MPVVAPRRTGREDPSGASILRVRHPAGAERLLGLQGMYRVMDIP